jgi:hypothetical protein
LKASGFSINPAGAADTNTKNTGAFLSIGTKFKSVIGFLAGVA